MFATRSISYILLAASCALVLAKPAPFPEPQRLASSKRDLPTIKRGLPTAKRSSCSTGTTSCCNTIVHNDQPSYQDLAGILPIGAQGAGVPIAVGCTPISALGAGAGATCSSQATCCADYYGTYGVNCSPVGL